MEVGWGGEGGMVGNIGLLASHLSHLTKSHRPQKDILPPFFKKIRFLVFLVHPETTLPDGLETSGRRVYP